MSRRCSTAHRRSGSRVWGPRGHPLTRWAVLGLVIGFAGTALMLVPDGGLQRASLLAELGVLGAGIAFSLWTLYYRSVDPEVGSLVVMGMQLVSGGLMLLIVALQHGDTARWAVNAPGRTALAYLPL